MKSIPQMRWLLVLVPVLLIGGTYGVIRWLGRSETAAGLRAGVTYEIWLAEAEVTPAKPGGRAWDLDGSAPDLNGMITWQNQRVLETVTADGGLIACWDPVAVGFKQVLHGEADTASVRRVARVRAEDGAALEIGVFDDDLANREFVGAFHVPWTALREGINEIHGKGAVRRLAVVVVETGRDAVAMPTYQAEGVTELAETPPAMRGAVARATDNAAAVANQAAKEVGEEAEDLGRKAGDAAKATKDWIKGKLGK